MMNRRNSEGHDSPSLARIAGLGMSLLALILLFMIAPAVRADNINVTTDQDVVDANSGDCDGLTFAQLPGPDGMVSLREALCAANTNPDPDTILLLAETYVITQTGVGDNWNVAGDLDILVPGGDLTISGAGAGMTIIDGNGGVTGDRVLDIVPNDSDTITVTISGVTLQHGSVPGTLGGGLYVDRAHNVYIQNSTIYSNTALDGGGIWTRLAMVEITNSTLSGNKATRDGGGIFHDVGSGEITIKGSTISDNQAALSGGAIRNDEGASKITIDSSTLSRNRATSANEVHGGAIYNYDGEIEISLSALFNNEATCSGSNRGAGGAIYHRNGTLTITTSDVVNNTASGATLESVGGGITTRDGSVTITYSTISGNVVSDTFGAQVYGGGLGLDGTAVTITHSLISGNHSGYSGGGIDIGSGSLVMTNTTVSGNTANDSGGGIYSALGKVKLDHVTITGNVADNDRDDGGQGGGIGRNAYPFELKNTIIAGNMDNSPSPANRNPDCFQDATSYGNNLIGDQTGCATTTWQASDQVGGNGSPAIDPLLYPLADNGGQTHTHALRPGSPAVDAATCTDIGGTSITNDQRFESRPWGPPTACDVGAYEAKPDPTNIKIATPATGVPYHGEVTYTIVLTNNGAGHMYNASVSDILPLEVTFARWLPGGKPAGAVSAPDSISWSGPVSGGQVITFAFVVTHTGDYGDVVENTAEFNYSFGSGGDDATFKVQNPPNLGITKSVTPDTGLAYRDPVTYTITLSNSGEAVAVGVHMTDSLPALARFADWVPGGKPPGADVDRYRHISWLGDIPSGTQITLAFVADQKAGWGDVVTNTAYYHYTVGSDSAQAAFAVRSKSAVYLPVVLKSTRP